MDSAERESLLDTAEALETDDDKDCLMRWWVLSVISMHGILQSALWNFYGPIQESVASVYGWDADEIDYATNASTIAFVFTVFAWSVIIDMYGPRTTSQIAAAFTAMSAVLRCVPASDEWHRYPVLASMILNGLAGPPVAIVPPLISAMWFPPDQRTTATALMTMIGTLGIAIGFVVGPYMVDETASHAVQRAAIESLYYAECIMSMVMLGFLLMAFPNRPQRPPSQAAQLSSRGSVEASKVISGWTVLARWPRGWVLFLSMGVPTGVYQGWSFVLDFNLQQMGIDEDLAGWIGFWQVVFGTVLSVFIAQLCDRFPGNLKSSVVVMYMVAGVAYTWISLIGAGLVDYTKSGLSGACVLAGTCMVAVVPIFYELGIETTHPIGAGVTTGFMEFVQMLVQATFCSLPISEIGTLWMNWTTLLCTVGGMVCLLIWEEKYRRLSSDTKEEISDSFVNEILEISTCLLDEERHRDSQNLIRESHRCSHEGNASRLKGMVMGYLDPG